MRQKRRRTQHRLVILLMVVGILAGCASAFQDIEEKVSRGRFRPDHEALAAALAAYELGDYAKALVDFKFLAVESSSETVTRRAKLGEICCRLMLADAAAAHNAAVGMWIDYREAAIDPESVWQLRLLTPVVVNQMPFPSPHAGTVPEAVHHAATHAKPAEHEKAAPSTPGEGRAQPELTELKQKAREADQLRKQLDQLTAENKSLQEKIKALEAIDQSIQKKKTEISAPVE